MASSNSQALEEDDGLAFQRHLGDMMQQQDSTIPTTQPSARSEFSQIPLDTPAATSNPTPNWKPFTAPNNQGSKIDQVKTWTLDTLKTTKQFINEKLGKSSKTVNPELDAKIEELRNLQFRYDKLVVLTINLKNHMSNVIFTQKQIVDTLADLAQRDTKLAEDFNFNMETQRVLIRNGDQLLGALQFFISNMQTLCSKTIQDCLDTIKKYELARLQYDTMKNEQEQSAGLSGNNHQKYEQRKKIYEQLRDDVSVKLRFLDENKVKVVHRQMMLFHNAIAAYFSGNQKQLQTILEQFSVKVRTPNSEPPSWLEK